MPKKPEPEEISVTVMMSRDLVDVLDKTAEQQDRSRASLIRQFVIRALEQQEKTA